MGANCLTAAVLVTVMDDEVFLNSEFLVIDVDDPMLSVRELPWEGLDFFSMMFL